MAVIQYITEMSRDMAVKGLLVMPNRVSISTFSMYMSVHVSLVVHAPNAPSVSVLVPSSARGTRSQ